MVSLETRAIALGLLPGFVAFLVFATIDTAYGFPAEVTSLAIFVIVAVLGLAVPQLYLARTDDTVPPQWRVRTVLVLFLVIGSVVSADATLAEGAVIWSIISGTFLFVIGYELRAGYLASTDTGTDQLSAEK